MVVIRQAISRDPLGRRWEQDISPPRKFRLDAVVAEVGRWVVVVGGESSMDREYEEEGSVEVYDKQTGRWESAGLMPSVFEGSTCATWLSVAATGKRLYMVERRSGWVSWFDPESMRWGPARRMRGDAGVSAWAMMAGGQEKLIVVGAGRAGSGGGTRVRAWEVEGEALVDARAYSQGVTLTSAQEEEVPREMAERLFPRKDRERIDIDVCGGQDGGYVCNPREMRNGVLLFQRSSASASASAKAATRFERWEWVPLPESVGHNPMARILSGSSPLAFEDVASAFAFAPL